MAIIETDKVQYAYSKEDKQAEKLALRGVTAAIEKGEFVAVLGHNGSGKSTFAKLLNAILLPTDGVVWVDGLDTRREELIFEVRETAGMVFQNPDNQIVATVVEEDVAFAPENLGLPQAEIRKRVDESLDAVGMREFARHAPHLLSGGQKQRIAIAGVLAMRPKVLVLDEPTAMLDPKGRAEVVKTVKRLNRETGMTVILITHHMDEAAEADRVLVMDHGRIIMDGTPRDIFSRVDEVRAVSLTVPQTVDLLYRLRGTGADVPIDALTVDECADALIQYLEGQRS